MGTPAFSSRQVYIRSLRSHLSELKTDFKITLLLSYSMSQYVFVNIHMHGKRIMQTTRMDMANTKEVMENYYQQKRARLDAGAVANPLYRCHM